MTCIREVWRKVNYPFPILSNVVHSDCTDQQYKEIEVLLQSLGAADQIRDLVIASIEKYLRQHVAPNFWRRFIDTDEEHKGFQLFKGAVNDLYDSMCSFEKIIDRLDKLNSCCIQKKVIWGELNIVDGFKQIIRATLLSQLPLHFQVIVNLFYKVSFNVFDKEVDSNDDMLDCMGCSYEATDCQCNYIIKVFHDANSKLMEMQLLERLAGQVLTKFIQERIELHILKTCKGFEKSYLKALENWLDETVMSWLTRIYCGGSANPPKHDQPVFDAILKFKQKLSSYLYNSYTTLRITELFNIIIEYPDSKAAIDDIRLCLEKTDLRRSLCDSLQKALETRLLHPGVNTPDILTAYISAIRALKHLDPSGLLLETVTKPVRTYLRTRDDTVRSVVSNLTEDSGGSELAEELAKFAGDGDGIENDEEEVWEEWNPDPVDVAPQATPKKRTNDIISMLVNVYGSKDLFVNEYRTLLADRLLAQNVINTEKEIRYLELLKIRFGESQLHFCEVMLKDISDSKRINSLIQQDSTFANKDKKFISNAMILSAQFWPPFRDETLELPEIVKHQLESYTKAFEALKGNRTLNWKPHLGNVNIEIEIGDKKVEYNVSPFNATIIMHFQEKPEWNLDDLCLTMKVPTTVLRRKMTYWQSVGLIREKGPDNFVLVEDNVNKANISQSSQLQEMVCEEDEAESAMASAHDQREGELQVFWSYIVGMLTNLDSLNLERIHQMLKMFASQAPGSECSVHELRQFLDTKVRSHQLLLQGGMYRLPKN